MVKNLFSWGYSGVLVPLLYGLGAGFWALALNTDPSKRHYYAAAGFFLLGLIWTFGWLWTHDSPGRSRPRHTDAEKYARMRKPVDPNEPSRRRHRSRPRRRHRKLRWTAAVLAALIVLTVDARILGTYKVRTARKDQGELQVFIADMKHPAALGVPVLERPEDTKDMMFAMMGVPDNDVQVQRGDTSRTVEVVLRSTYARSIRNAHVQIDSDVPIRPAGPGLKSWSETELVGEITEIRPAGKSAFGYALPVEVSVAAYQSKAGLLVTIVGDNIRPYAAATRIVFAAGTVADRAPVPLVAATRLR